MRGKVFMLFAKLVYTRITPAYAGKSFWHLEFHHFRQDHPRLCGEKQISSVQEESGAGSPPPMRGKVLTLPVILRVSGITPAYAGKSCKLEKQSKLRQDHPRLCGEKHPLLPPPFHDVGSPPPMRGKDRRDCKRNSLNRITPAYAGKSSRYRLISISSRDHPRLCGEKREVK